MRPHTQPQNDNSKLNVSVSLPEQRPLFNGEMPPPVDPLREYDTRALEDPLIPPYKRDDYNIDPYLVYPQLYSFPTRGLSASFRKVGTLINKTAANDDKYKFLILMGRQKYRGSTQFEYYVVSDSKESTIKFELPNKREIYSEDIVKIRELGDAEYTAHVDRNLPYEYIPYVL